MPSTTALSVYDQIVKNGRVTRGSIGVSFQEEQGTNQMTLKYLGAPYGVVIQGIEPGSPAEKAGLKDGDVITAINGTAVKTGNDLVNPIAGAPIGSRVKITYYRDKQQRETRRRSRIARAFSRMRPTALMAHPMSRPRRNSACTSNRLRPSARSAWVWKAEGRGGE